MREEGDKRLASVYKPEKRGKLMVRPFSPGDLTRPAAGVGNDAMRHSRSTLCFWWRIVSRNASYTLFCQLWPCRCKGRHQMIKEHVSGRRTIVSCSQEVHWACCGEHLHVLPAQVPSLRAGLHMQTGVSCWLQEAGYTILACFGDQWSDLSGPFAGLASFLLPNPFYYLL